MPRSPLLPELFVYVYLKGKLSSSSDWFWTYYIVRLLPWTSDLIQLNILIQVLKLKINDVDRLSKLLSCWW